MRGPLAGYQKRCGPSPEKSLLRPAKAQNSDGLTVRPNQQHGPPLQQAYAQGDRGLLRSIVPRLIHAYHAVLLPARWLPQFSLGKKRAPLDATRLSPQRTDK